MLRLIINSTIILSCFNLICCSSKSKQNTHTPSSVSTQGVHAAFYNAKGDRIAFCTSQGNLFITDDSFVCIAKVVAHTGNAYSSFFSEDGKHIVTGGKDGLLKLWTVDSLIRVRQFNFKGSPYTSIYGYHTVSACGEHGKLATYQLTGNKVTETILDSAGAYFLYSIIPDTTVLVSSGNKGYEVDVVSGKIMHQYTGHNGAVYCIMPGLSNQRVVTSCTDSIVRIFDRQSQALLFRSSVLDGQVYVATYNPLNNNVAVATSSGSIFILDTTLRHISRQILAFKGRVNTIHFSPDGSRIVAGSEDGGVKLFSTSTGQMLSEFKW
ncbi:MAG TPA: hypothetical protein VK154_09550 [Chitinophagales bacterium]|nr:hypothetical protein [Chitinophagales bacterium]